MEASKNLERLATAFTVRDIMVSMGDLACTTGMSAMRSAGARKTGVPLEAVSTGPGASLAIRFCAPVID
jgi:hypothetical protein